MNSTEIAQCLVQRGFKALSNPKRTKAHGYKHALMPNPLYVKIGGTKGALKSTKKFALVLHPDDEGAIARTQLPSGVQIANTPYKSAGLLTFRTDDGSTPWGRDVDIADEVALDALLAQLLTFNTSTEPLVPPPQGTPRGSHPESHAPFSAYAFAAATAEIEADQKTQGIDQTTRERLVLARLGQGAYRQRLMALWDGRCAVTGCATSQALIASHAKPWAESDNRERLDEYNGLLLTASIDRLFDQGLIAFTDDGDLLRKPTLQEADLEPLGLSPKACLRSVKKEHIPYLAEHRRRHGF